MLHIANTKLDCLTVINKNVHVIFNMGLHKNIFYFKHICITGIIP